MTSWTTSDIPDQTGRVAVITGATGGIGFEAALALAAAGAEVVLTGRNAAKGDAALKRIHQCASGARIRYEHLDLASLASVAAFADMFSRDHAKLDMLINNAGVMMPPKRQVTADGFELQWGTNYLGHFALTAHLLPTLRASTSPRVVNISSIAHRYRAAIHFDDLQWEKRYDPWLSYAQSKLAMLMFALELQRRSDTNRWGLASIAAHPGYARTDLIANGPGEFAGPLGVINKVFASFASHSAADGALPTLFAATSPDARGGGYYGPRDLFELRGPVKSASVKNIARDRAVAAQLWAVSEQETGAHWPQASTE